MGTIVPVPHYVDLKFPDGKLAARYDPVRGILEIRRGGANHYFDLAIVAEPLEIDADVCYNFNN